MAHSKCKNLFRAATSLLEGSGLVSFVGKSFVSKHNEDHFEGYWKEKIDPDFGRYMAWVWFSVGSENLAKASLVCSGLVNGAKVKLGYPVYSPELDKASWIDRVLEPLKGDCGPDEALKFEFGTLDETWKHKLDKLAGIDSDNKRELTAAYKYLTQAIRNRDAHTYIEYMRRKDFPAVDGIFVPAFNTLVQTMERNGHFETLDNVSILGSASTIQTGRKETDFLPFEEN